MGIVELIAGILTGKAGEKIGGAVSGIAQVGALIAALAPIAVWLTGHKDDVFITLTYGGLAFWSAVVGLQVYLVVRLVHRAPSPD